MRDSEVDIVVIGSGAGGMTAALTGALQGLDVAILEKAPVIGGTTAVSAGSIWVPNTHLAPARSDSIANARRYLQATIGARLRAELCEAFLTSAPVMTRYLEQHSHVALRAYAHHPDYLATAEGATLAGRVLEPVPFDGRMLRGEFKRLRDPLPEFMLLGGMMVDRVDIGHLMNAGRKLASARHAVGLLARFALDRIRFHRGTRLVMGNALAGRLLYSLIQAGVNIRTNSLVSKLTGDANRIDGVLVSAANVTEHIHARRGVVLATGGFSRHETLRHQLLPAPVPDYSPIVESITGDGVDLGLSVGGRLGEHHADSSFWAPMSVSERADGSTAVFPHFVLDRGKPGLIAIDASGQRFVSEATTYHLFARAMYAANKTSSAIPCYFICDHNFVVKYGLGMIRPRGSNLARAIATGYIVRAETLTALAALLGIPATALEASVARSNTFAHTGVDAEFGKGSDAYQRNLGDPLQRPNPCLGTIKSPPFYALAVYPGDIGASVGLVTDENAQVLQTNGLPIGGLYACGNDMDSMMAGIYPGPGVTLGPAMTFGFRAACHAAGSNNLRVTALASP